MPQSSRRQKKASISDTDETSSSDDESSNNTTSSESDDESLSARAGAGSAANTLDSEEEKNIAAQFAKGMDLVTQNHVAILASNPSFLQNLDDASDSESEEPEEEADSQAKPKPKAWPKRYRAKSQISDIDAAWAAIKQDGGVNDLLQRFENLSEEDIKLAFVLHHSGIELFHHKAVTKGYKDLKRKHLAIKESADLATEYATPIVNWLVTSIDATLKVFAIHPENSRSKTEAFSDLSQKILELLLKNIRNIVKLVYTKEDSAIVRFYLSLIHQADKEDNSEAAEESFDESTKTKPTLYSPRKDDFKTRSTEKDSKVQKVSMQENATDFDHVSTLLKKLPASGKSTVKRFIISNFSELAAALLKDLAHDNAYLTHMFLTDESVCACNKIIVPRGKVARVDAAETYHCQVSDFNLTMVYFDGNTKEYFKTWRAEHKSSNTYLLLRKNDQWYFGGFDKDENRVDIVSLKEKDALKKFLAQDFDNFADLTDRKVLSILYFLIEEYFEIPVASRYLKDFVSQNCRKILQEFLIINLRRNLPLLSMTRPSPAIPVLANCSNASHLFAYIRFYNQIMMRTGANLLPTYSEYSIANGSVTLNAVCSPWQVGFNTPGSVLTTHYLKGEVQNETSRAAFGLRQLSNELEVAVISTYDRMLEKLPEELKKPAEKKKISKEKQADEKEQKKALVTDDILFGELIRYLLHGDNKSVNSKRLDEVWKKMDYSSKTFVASVMLLLCGFEGMRNPAIFIVNQMLLDLIINAKLTWNKILCNDESAMPTAAKGSTACSRKINNYFARYMPHIWQYPGTSLPTSEKTSMGDIISKEASVFRLWLESNDVPYTSETSCTELASSISTALPKWFNFHR